MSSIGSIYTDFTLKAAYCFDNKSFEYQHFCGLVFDSKLELMKKEIVKYLILTPKEKVPGCWFIQGKKEKEDYRIEVSIDEDGRNLIYAMECVTFEECRRFFFDFLDKKHIPDITDWSFVGEFASPEE